MRIIGRLLLGVSLLGPGATAPALANDRIIGGAIGVGIGIGAAILLNEASKERNRANRQTRQRAAPRVQTAEEIEAVALRKEVQRRLNVLGYNVGKPDGVYGRKTRAAISAFQASLGEAATGRITEAQVAALYSKTGGGAQGFASLSDAPAPAPFPTLAPAGNASGTGAVPAFPPLATEAAVDAALPAQVPPEAAPPVSPFPSLGGAKIEVKPGQMPQLTASASAFGVDQDNPKKDADAAVVQAGPRDLASELARIDMTIEDQPAVVGIFMGQDFSEVSALLEEAGFAECASATSPMSSSCGRSTAALDDKILVHAHDDVGVWAIARTISFKSPVPLGALEGTFRESYPSLMGRPSNTKLISSNEMCGGEAVAEQLVRTTIDGIAAWAANPEEAADESLTQYSERCPIMFKLEFVGSDEAISGANIVFVDATVVDAVQSAREEAGRKQFETVSKDLKL